MENGQLIQILGSTLFAIIPALAWGLIFYKKNPEDKKLTILTFIVGALAVAPILLYKYLWQFFPWINAFQYTDNLKDDLIGFSNIAIIPIGIVLTFLIVGVIEEVMKFSAVRIVDKDKFRNVDDAIEFCIIAALGFSFAENIIYFQNIWANVGTEGLFLPFVFRSLFSTFAHLLFSGVFGYYYGVAYFAKPILQEELRNKRCFFTKLLHKISGIKKTKIFHQEKLLEGLLFAVILHAVFDVFLEMKWTFLVVPYLIGGYILLSYLLSKKENHKNYDKLMVGERNIFKE